MFASSGLNRRRTVVFAGVLAMTFGSGLVGGYLVQRARTIAAQVSPQVVAAARAERLAQFRAAPGGASIVMLGDSLTSQGEWSELLGVVVANRGVAGDTTQDVLDRLDTLPVGDGPVFLMIGVNDLVRGAQPDQVAAATRRIVTQISPRPVIVQSVLFTSDPALAGAVRRVNALNRAYCAQGPCRFLDLNDLVSRDGVLRADMTVDGVHLAGRAYPPWAARVMAAAR